MSRKQVYAVYDAAAKHIVGGNIFDLEQDAHQYISRLSWSRANGEVDARGLHVIEVPAPPAALEPDAPAPLSDRLVERMAAASRGSVADPIE